MKTVAHKGCKIDITIGDNGFIFRLTSEDTEHCFYFKPGHGNGLMRAARKLLKFYKDKFLDMHGILEGTDEAS